MIDTRAAGGAAVITAIPAAITFLVEGISTTSETDLAGLFKSMGVFGAALAIAYFMLKRGDKREKEIQDSVTIEHKNTRAEFALMQASNSAIMQKYVDALIEIANLKTEIANLRSKT